MSCSASFYGTEIGVAVVAKMVLVVFAINESDASRRSSSNNDNNSGDEQEPF